MAASKSNITVLLIDLAPHPGNFWKSIFITLEQLYIFTTGKNLEKTTSSLAVPSKDARINKHVRLGVKSPGDAYFFIQTKTKIFVPLKNTILVD